MSTAVATPAAALACRRCKTAIEAGDLRCSVCALTVPEAPRDAVARPAAKILRCRECNAAVSYTVEKQAPACGFCGSVMEVEQPIDPVEQAPDSNGARELRLGPGHHSPSAIGSRRMAQARPL